MASIVIAAGTTFNINHPENDSVTFLGAGTLNIAGTAGAPIDVTLSSMAGVSVATTVTITNARVHLNGTAGLSALTNYRIGAGASLEIGSTLGIAAGSTVTFTGQSGSLVVDQGLDLGVFSAIGGFGPGNTIDLAGRAVTSLQYTDASGSNTGGQLTIVDSTNHTTTLTLNTGDFATANFATMGDGSNGTLISFTSYVTGTTITAPASTIGAGRTATITVSTSNPVVVMGTPALSLNDGGIASFDAQSSTATSLVFRTTVQPGQNAASLAVTAVTLPAGASVTDTSGNPVNLQPVIGTPVGTVRVDTAAPTVLAVTTDPVSGTIGLGQLVHFNVAVSEPVTVSGSGATLTLSDGGTATLNAATSTASNLVFDHTVLAGQNTADLAVVGVGTAGVTVTDGAANLLDLSAAIGNPAGTLVVNTTPAPPPASGTAPTIVSVGTTPGSGNVVAGDTVKVVLGIDHAVSVTGGTPTLVLSDGGIAVFDPANSTSTSLLFNNVVQAGQTSSDLSIVGYDLNGAVVADGNGAALSLAAAEVNPAGILTVGLQSGGGGGSGGSGSGGSGGGGTGGGSGGGTGGGTSGGGGGGTGGGSGNGGTTDPGTGTDPSDGDTDSTSGSTDISPGSTYATIPIYRFFESANGTHFYTPSAAERDQIVQTRPDFVSEGVGLRAIDPNANDPNGQAVYRFFDKVHGTQFLTASTTERDAVIAARSDLTYEPNGTFFEHTQPQAGDTAVYRFFSSSDGTHFYTDSASERANILQTRPDLVAEGIGFYEPAQS